MPTTQVICPLHGIRTLAMWQRGLSDLLARHGWVCRLDRWSYGRFSILAFVTPWTGEAKLGWLRRQYDAEMHDRRLILAKGRPPSVVAHSFGTYILGYTLLGFDFIRFDKVILCGSILPPDFPWDHLIERQVQALRTSSASATRGSAGSAGSCEALVRRGPSGSRASTRGSSRRNSTSTTVTTSGSTTWRTAGSHSSAGPSRKSRVRPPCVFPRPKSTTPWGLYAAVMALTLLTGAVATFVASRRGTETTGASPASQSTATGAAFIQSPAAILEGYVTDAETRRPLADVKLTIQDWKTRDGASPPPTTTDANGQFRLPTSSHPAIRCSMSASWRRRPITRSAPPIRC